MKRILMTAALKHITPEQPRIAKYGKGAVVGGRAVA
jgi:hypothetical protein